MSEGRLGLAREFALPPGGRYGSGGDVRPVFPEPGEIAADEVAR
jgi:hypothetical protein